MAHDRMRIIRAVVLPCPDASLYLAGKSNFSGHDHLRSRSLSHERPHTGTHGQMDLGGAEVKDELHEVHKEKFALPLASSLRERLQEKEELPEEPDLFVDKKETGKKFRRKHGRPGLIFILMGSVLFIPLGSSISEEGIVVTETHALVGVVVPGVLTDVFKIEGDKVASGEVIARFENHELKRELQEARFRKQAFTIEQELYSRRIRFMEKELERKRMLYETENLSRAEFERVELELEETRNQHKKIENEKAAMTGVIASLEGTLNGLEIKSAAEGILLTDLSVRIGNYFHAGEELFQIGDPKRMLVELFVSERLVSQLKKGDPVKIRFPALPSKSFTGRIYRIAPEAQEKIEKVFKVRTVVAVLIRLDEVPGDLTIGMRAEGKFSRRGISLIHRIYNLFVSSLNGNMELGEG